MGRRRGCLWFGAGGLLAIMAGILAFVVMQRVASVAPARVEEEPKAPVLVAARSLPLRTLIQAADVVQRQVPPNMIPADALVKPEDAVGQLTIDQIGEGEIIMRRRLIAPDYVGPNAALVMSPTQVLISFPSSDPLSTLGIVRPGDHVDLMLTYKLTGVEETVTNTLTTFTMLQDLEIKGVIYSSPPEGNQQAANAQQGAASGPPKAYLLALDPQQALMIKYLRDTGAQPDFALRSPTAKGLFGVVAVDSDYILNEFRTKWRDWR